ncbi:hypothetical protein BC936DRAFT_140495 [Jimgerdemannia flammicorona]|uniref:Uncharacterized protein n=1 Tax=Jimgerdemannia flammicorona TaxID=994334 RepID=A0A433ATS1_9FUNG|nr:hypothetical protein BC936DRAFT_140495 [Jimgerdemannia flammicorona]
MDLPRLNISTTDAHTTPPERHTIAVSSPVTAQRKPFFDGIFDSPKRQSTGSLAKPKDVTVDKTPLMSANDFLRSSQVTEDYQIESRSSQNTDYNYYPGGGTDDTTRLNDYPPSQIGDNKESTTTEPDSDVKSHRRISSNYTYTATSFPKATINSNRFSSSGRPPSTSFYSNPLPSQYQNAQSARNSYISNKRLSGQKLAYLDGVNNVMVPSGLPNVVVRVERDYTRGDGITQFEKTFPGELEGRVRVLLQPYSLKL